MWTTARSILTMLTITLIQIQQVITTLRLMVLVIKSLALAQAINMWSSDTSKELVR